MTRHRKKMCDRCQECKAKLFRCFAPPMLVCSECVTRMLNETMEGGRGIPRTERPARVRREDALKGTPPLPERNSGEAQGT